MWLSFVCFLCFLFFLCVFLFLVCLFFNLCLFVSLPGDDVLCWLFSCSFSSVCFPFFFFLDMFLVWFGLVCFCLSCDHGWIHRGSVNVRYNNNKDFSLNNNSCSTTIPSPVAQSLAFPLFRQNAYPVLFMNLALCFVARM